MTQKTYYSNAYIKEAVAKVISCEKSGDHFEAILSQTIFFPEGGGQPGDTGFINGKKVYDCHEKDGIVYHYLLEEIETGECSCSIDFSRRFDFMQNHTGEHIVSGIVNRRFGYSNTSFHMSLDDNSRLIMVAFDFDGIFTPQDLDEIEKEANEKVFANEEVKTLFPSAGEAQALDFRSKREIADSLRLVLVGENIDKCACCGLHVKRTGEVGAIKILSAQSHRRGTRVFFACGRLAYEDACMKSRVTKELTILLSSKPELLVEAVKAKLSDLTDANYKNSLYFEKYFRQKALAFQGLEKAIIIEEGLNSDELRISALILSEHADVSIVMTHADSQVKYSAASKNRDVRAFSKAINTAFSGKGGGQAALCQGFLNGNCDDIYRFATNYNQFK